jgi:sugar lactone lactonase YvrE
MTQSTGKIYFVEGDLNGGGTVKVMNADGSDETVLLTGEAVNEPDGIEVDEAAGKIYWTDMGTGGAADRSVAADDGRIMRANIDGSDVQTVVPLGHTTTPKQLTLDVPGGKVYWCDRGDVGDNSVNPKIMRVNFDGSDLETLVKDDVISPVGIALDVPKGKLYFTDRYANNIKRANLDGADVEIVVQNTTYPVDLALDLKNRWMFWTGRQDGTVFRTNMDENGQDGSKIAAIITGLTAPIGMGIDRVHNKIYYTEVFVKEHSGAIWCADTDGQNAVKLRTTALPLGLYFGP